MSVKLSGHIWTDYINGKHSTTLGQLLSVFTSLANDIDNGTVLLEESFIDKGSNKVVIKLSAVYGDYYKKEYLEGGE